MSFVGKITKDGIQFEPYNQIRFQVWLEQKAGKYARIEEIKSKRSLEQNSLYWLWLEIIANHSGHSPDELHRIIQNGND